MLYILYNLLYIVYYRFITYNIHCILYIIFYIFYILGKIYYLYSLLLSFLSSFILLRMLLLSAFALISTIYNKHYIYIYSYLYVLIIKYNILFSYLKRISSLCLLYFFFVGLLLFVSKYKNSCRV